MRRAFERIDLEGRLRCFENGKALIDGILSAHERGEMPGICLLDLKMELNGRVRMFTVRGRPQFLSLPLVVMSSSCEPSR
jgi:hypothetical protein